MGSVLALWLTGQTINIMTLGGLALAVGILVDEATVCIENIHTHLMRGRSIGRAALDATTETTVPRLLAMLCILAIFSPTLFMAGAAKAMFLPLSLAVGFAMVTSYLLSSTLVPILSVWVLRGHETAATGHARGGEPVRALSSSAMPPWAQKLVRARWAVVGVYLVLAAVVIVFLGRRLGTEIFPKVDAGQIQLRLRAPDGHADRAAPKPIALQALDLIKQEVGPQNVEITLGFLGVHGSPYPINFIYLWNGGPEEGVLQVQLKPGTPIRIEDLKERLRRVFAEKMPGVSFSFEPSDIVSRVMSLGSPTPIEIAISGQNLAADRAFAEQVKAALQRIPALRDLQFGQALDYPTVDVNVDREKAGVMGVKMADVSRALVTATSSSRFVVPNYWADPNSGVAYQVQVQVPQARMDSVEQVKNVPVLDHGGQGVLLRNVAKVTESTAVGQYERYNMQRMVTVTANIAGADLGSVAEAGQRGAQETGPAAARASPSQSAARSSRWQQMLDGLRTGLLLAVVVIFLLLAANFQSLKLSFLVVSTTPGGHRRCAPHAVADGHHAEHPVVHGRHHGGRRRRGQRHPAGDLCRAQPAGGGERGRGRGRRSAQPSAADSHDQHGHDRRHGADGPGLRRGRPANRAAGPGGGRRAGGRDRGDPAGAAVDLCSGPGARAPALGLAGSRRIRKLHGGGPA